MFHTACPKMVHSITSSAPETVCTLLDFIPVNFFYRKCNFLSLTSITC